MKHDKDYDRPADGDLKVRQPVELEIVSETELGFKAVVDGRYIGLIYHNEISQPLKPGELLKGWVKAVRKDGKVDLSITMLDSESRDELEEAVLTHLRENNGVAALTDKSSPDEIHRLFSTSKKNFKRAIGSLYKKRKIIIEDDRIRITEKLRKPVSPWAKKPDSGQ